MKVSFQVNDDSILIKCVDSHFNIYKCLINQYDPFVATFCGKKLVKLHAILQNHLIQEMDDHVILKVSEPVELQYILKKEKYNESESFSLILGKIESMEERIHELEEQTESLKLSTSDLIEQLEEGVILSGYAGGIIPKDATELFLNVVVGGNFQQRLGLGTGFGSNDYLIFSKNLSTNYSNEWGRNNDTSISFTNIFFNTQFVGKSIKPVSFLTNLQRFAIHGRPDISDFSPLRKCTNLLEIYFEKSGISNIDFVLDLKKLTTISFNSCSSLTKINQLTNCPSLQTIYIGGGTPQTCVIDSLSDKIKKF
jgi:hypothetical protein